MADNYRSTKVAFVMLLKYFTSIDNTKSQTHMKKWDFELYCNSIHLHFPSIDIKKNDIRLKFTGKYEVAFFLFDIMLLFIEVNTSN